MSDIRDNVENKAKAADETPSALQSEASNALNSRIRVVGDRSELLDTRASDPRGTKVGPSDPNAEISVTVMVKSKASDQEINDTVGKIANGKEKPLTDAEFNSRFGADPAEAIAIEDSSRGMRSALAAGIECIVVRNAFTQTMDFSGALRIVDSVTELPEALFAINRQAG